MVVEGHTFIQVNDECFVLELPGTASWGFASLIGDMKKHHEANFVILMETHSSGARAAGIIKRIGLKGSFVQEAQGHSGGIWCLWDTNWWTVDVITHSSQFVHMKVKYKNLNYWFLTAVHGAPQVSHRQKLRRPVVPLN